MSITRSGVAAEVLFMISCGDNLHLGTDAAVDAPEVDAALECDCPAAEPPLAGRLVVFSQLQTIPGNDTSAQGTACPAGAKLISGGCTTNVLDPTRNVTLQQSGSFDAPPTARGCFFRNNDPTPVVIRASIIRASIICLELAP